jgi:hypothetical protein
LSQASRPPAFRPLGDEYEPFLYAVIRDGNNGAPLTMLSVIARAGEDPWMEAARISRLPEDAALLVVKRMIEDCSDAAQEAPDCRATPTRLLALLSGRTRPPDTCPADADSGGAAILIVLAIFGGLMLASLLATLSHPAQGAKSVDRIEALSGPSNRQIAEPRSEILSRGRLD